LNTLCAPNESQFFDLLSLSTTLNRCLTHRYPWRPVPTPEPDTYVYNLPLSHSINPHKCHQRLTETGVLEQLEAGLISPLDIVGDWYTTFPASCIPVPIRVRVHNTFIADSEWNQAAMSAPYFPTPGKQEVLNSLPIPTDDDIPKLRTPSLLPAVPILLVTDLVTPLPGSITAEILESTDTPSNEHLGGYFIEAAQLPRNHPSIIIEHEGQPHFLKYVKYGLVNDDPCVLRTDGKGHNIYYTPLHAVSRVEGQYEQHHPPINESDLDIVLEDYIFNIPLQVAIHNLYDPGICTEVHRLRTTTSRMVSLRAARAHLREFQELIQIQLDVHNQQVEGMANQIVQIEK
jgi:hypothetical protein